MGRSERSAPEISGNIRVGRSTQAGKKQVVELESEVEQVTEKMCNSWFLMDRKSTLSILQYNVMKSKDKVIASLVRDEKVKAYAVLAVQEPWRKLFHHATHHLVSALRFGIY
jgi:hypothetical protein